MIASVKFENISTLVGISDIAIVISVFLRKVCTIRCSFGQYLKFSGRYLVKI